MTTERRPGRPPRHPDQPDTRAAILEAARAEFAVKGFEGASLRAVARGAGVDASLVHHYFGTKEGLMIAALELPFDPRELVPQMLADGVDSLPDRLARQFVTIWESEDERRPMLALIKAAVTSEAAADVVRTGWAQMIVEPLAIAMDTPDARLRAELVASQLVGLAMLRYVIAVEPLASADPEDVIARLAVTIRAALLDAPGA